MAKRTTKTKRDRLIAKRSKLLADLAKVEEQLELEDPDPRPRRARLLLELERIEEALDRARLDADPTLVETQIQISGLTANYWLIRKRLADKVSDEIDLDRRHHEAQTQFARLSSKRQADLLPKVLARLSELEADEAALREAARRRETE